MKGTNMSTPFDIAMEALKAARAKIEAAEIELQRMHEANNLLALNIQNMRAAYDTLAGTVKEQGKAFESLAKQNGPRPDPVPRFLTERRNYDNEHEGM